jgi:hypothetical protein
MLSGGHKIIYFTSQLAALQIQTLFCSECFNVENLLFEISERVKEDFRYKESNKD